MISTGGTLIALINAVKKIGATIVDVIVVAEKVEYNGVHRVFKNTGIYVKTLIKVSVKNNTSKVI
jgi:adenine phosphoribosyltransferase